MRIGGRGKMWIRKFRLLLTTTLFALFTTVSIAQAEEYPYSGYFTVRSEDTPAAMLQAACALDFFKKEADGTAFNYMLDEELYRKDGTVSYIVSDRTVCAYVSQSGIDSCIAELYHRDGIASRVFFISYDSLPGDNVRAVLFRVIEDIYAFLRSLDKAIPNSNYPSAKRYNIHRCEGFTDETIASHLTQKRNALSPDETTSYFSKPIDKDAIPMILDVMQKIGKKAFNATLPGQ
jgi:hypothetical protein